uniref:(northern house mosquito) hypothetical protein n=1 Tax=Culex pipiens TaxID=7175 RepID=A0A8D8FER3_CULPI
MRDRPSTPHAASHFRPTVRVRRRREDRSAQGRRAAAGSPSAARSAGQVRENSRNGAADERNEPGVHPDGEQGARRRSQGVRRVPDDRPGRAEEVPRAGQGALLDGRAAGQRGRQVRQHYRHTQMGRPDPGRGRH